MNLIKAINFVAILFACSLQVHAQKGYVKQSRLPRSLHKVEFGVTTAGMGANYKGYFIGLDEKKNNIPMTSYHEGPMVSKGGLGVTLSTYSRPPKIGKSTAVTFDRGVMYNFLFWKGLGKGFYPDKEWHITGSTKMLSIPLGVSLRLGCDARLEKNHRFCLSAGGGILPYMLNTKLDDEDKDKKYVKLGAVPYVKVETGLFLGICWKIRLMYAMGDMQIMNEDDKQYINKDKKFWLNNFSSVGQSSLNVSLILMPFSYDWPDNGWWNQSRTSKKMFKGWNWRHKNNY